jgi:dolichol-phosphate mannosyltransferase
MLLLDKLVGHIVPARFVVFTLVGSFGVLVHLLTLTFFFQELKVAFGLSQALATFVAMTSNFAFNNMLTYRDRRLRGWQWWRGWGVFLLACSIGTAANVGIAVSLFEKDTPWAFAALAGTLVGAVWNYTTTRLYAWKRHHKSDR